MGYLALAGICAAMLAGRFFGHWDIGAIIAAALRMTFNFGVFLSAARLLFHWYIERESLRELRPEHLQTGVVLSDDTWATLAEEGELAGKLERYSDGLSAQEADVLKAWLASRAKDPQPAPAVPGQPAKPPQRYMIYETIPFAVWIFLGSLFTVLRRKNMVALLVPHLGHASGALKAVAARWLS
jgi:hypothetical protein